MTNLRTLSVAFTLCMIDATFAIKQELEALGDSIFSDPADLNKDQGGLESAASEGSEALYYDPKEDVIYEITSDDPDASTDNTGSASQED